MLKRDLKLEEKEVLKLLIVSANQNARVLNYKRVCVTKCRNTYVLMLRHVTKIEKIIVRRL